MISEPKKCGRNIDIHIHSGTICISLGRKLVDPNLGSSSKDSLRWQNRKVKNCLLREWNIMEYIIYMMKY